MFTEAHFILWHNNNLNNTKLQTYVYSENLTFKEVMLFTGWHIIWISIWATIVAALYHYTSFNNVTIF